MSYQLIKLTNTSSGSDNDHTTSNIVRQIATATDDYIDNNMTHNNKSQVQTQPKHNAYTPLLHIKAEV